MPVRVFRRELRATYSAPILAVALLAGVVLWRVSTEQSSVRWVEHTREVIVSTKDAQLDLRDMALAVRSYWISSDKRYLADFQDSDRSLAAELAKLSALVVDNPYQEQRLLEA